jgi:hypothetical protein
VHGCCGCHDIPGFEDAKPIGPALSDWGRKKESLLDCGRVEEYLRSRSPSSTRSASDALEPYYVRAIRRRSRIGFLAQKLREPRSFDYQVKKDYYTRLQMPQFSFDAQQQEQIMTFVLGLVAQPPASSFVHHPDAAGRAVQTGRDVLDQYNCAGCHLLKPQSWHIACRSGEIPRQPAPPTFPFVAPSPTKEQLAASSTPNEHGRLHATLLGMPDTDDTDGLPLVLDEDEEPLEGDEDYEPDALLYLFDLWDDAQLDGHVHRPGVVPLLLTAPMIQKQRSPQGGDLARLLAPRALAHVRQTNPVARGSEVWAWLPPPLIGQGQRVQSPWLHDYLLDPTPIRPAVLMKMPRFCFHNQDASQLVKYFAVIEGVEQPYDRILQRQETYLASARDRYQQRLAKLGDQQGKPIEGEHLSDAMRIVVDENYCVKCHLIGDFSPGGNAQMLAPNLAKVYRRLRPDYLRRWIADPVSVLPYTTMPAYIPYQEGAPYLGGVPQDLYHGTSTEQLDALVDLLLNFDRHSVTRSPISPMAEAAKEAE